MIKKNLRNTEQRQIVYDAVIGRCDHPTAEEIYFDIHKNYPNISKSTVYRNLDVLSNEGKIQRIKIPGGDRFDLTLCGHSHVVCKMCGKVIDTHINEKNVESEVSKETGFEIVGHNLFFEGICPDCLNKIKNN